MFSAPKLQYLPIIGHSEGWGWNNPWCAMQVTNSCQMLLITPYSNISVGFLFQFETYTNLSIECLSEFCNNALENPIIWEQLWNNFLFHKRRETRTGNIWNSWFMEKKTKEMHDLRIIQLKWVILFCASSCKLNIPSALLHILQKLDWQYRPFGSPATKQGTPQYGVKLMFNNNWYI